MKNLNWNQISPFLYHVLEYSVDRLSGNSSAKSGVK